MLVSGRRKAHIPGNLARYMFLKKCNKQDLNLTVEFLKMAGRLYPGHSLPKVDIEVVMTEKDHVLKDLSIQLLSISVKHCKLLWISVATINHRKIDSLHPDEKLIYASINASLNGKKRGRKKHQAQCKKNHRRHLFFRWNHQSYRQHHRLHNNRRRRWHRHRRSWSWSPKDENQKIIQ